MPEIATLRRALFIAAVACLALALALALASGC